MSETDFLHCFQEQFSMMSARGYRFLLSIRAAKRKGRNVVFKDGSSWLDVIDDAGVLVRRKGVNLCKKGDHPQYLGDYDGLAYDPATETVWVIECKEFEKTESAFDYMQLQQRWFGKEGKLLKNERRIKYLQEHLVEVAADLGFDHTGKLRIRPYLVSNKLFMNVLGQSNFQVITLSELGSLLEKENGA